MEASNRSHTDEIIGQQIRNYRIGELLATGGMGRIFRAQHLTLNQPVAFKLMHAHLAENPTFVTRFQREARTISKLSHPNIISVYDFAEHEHLAYLAMELVDGGTLRNYLAPSSRPELAVCIELICQAADALSYAHEQGIVHRDIKPENLFLTTDPLSQALVLKIGDFGLAHTADAGSLTVAGTIMGTIAYMAPEQATGQPVDGRADIYALGIILYEICAGTTPFNPTTPAEAIFSHVFCEPPALSAIRSDIPAGLVTIIERCLAKDPTARYRTADELALALRTFLATNPLAGPAGMMQQQVLDLDSTLFAGAAAPDQFLVERITCNAAVLAEVQPSIEPPHQVLVQNSLYKTSKQEKGAEIHCIVGDSGIDLIRLAVAVGSAEQIELLRTAQNKVFPTAAPEVGIHMPESHAGYRYVEALVRRARAAWVAWGIGSNRGAYPRVSLTQIASAVAGHIRRSEQCRGNTRTRGVRPPLTMCTAQNFGPG